MPTYEHDSPVSSERNEGNGKYMNGICMTLRLIAYKIMRDALDMLFTGIPVNERI